MTTTKRLGLGKNVINLGLKELLSEINNGPKTNKFSEQLLPIEYLRPGKYQPRKTFEQAALEELAESIRQQGLIQPIIVRAISEKEYEIIAGERRWRASKLAGLREVPVVIRKINDGEALAIALIENIQRENLNAIEQAEALQQLAQEFTMTHQEIATMVGKSRTTVTNLLRLLHLNSHVQSLIASGAIEMGHARALLALNAEEQIQTANTIVSKGLSVRETERLITNYQRPKPLISQKPIDPHIKTLETDLKNNLGVKVEIVPINTQKGKLIIHYNNFDDLDNITAKILDN